MNFQTHYSVSTKKDILSIFSLDLNRFPEQMHMQSGYLQRKGDNSCHFLKELPFPECGIFDQVKGGIYNDGRIRNFVFTNLYTGIDIPRIEVLINRISDIYGEDLLGRGAFEDTDRRQLIRGAWVGRIYSDIVRYRSPMIISLINNNLQLMLTIKKDNINSSLN